METTISAPLPRIDPSWVASTRRLRRGSHQPWKALSSLARGMGAFSFSADGRVSMRMKINQSGLKREPCKVAFFFPLPRQSPVSFLPRAASRKAKLLHPRYSAAIRCWPARSTIR